MATEYPVRSFLLPFTSEIPHIWFNGNTYLTQFINFNFAILPPLERFLIKQARKHLRYVENPELKTQLEWFVKQEAQHFKAHEDYNHWLENNGYPIQATLERTDAVLRHLEENYSVLTILGFCCFTEHLTAVLSRMFISNDQAFSHIDGTMARLMRWHGMEELEHKSIMYDLFLALGGDYRIRIKSSVLQLRLLGRVHSQNWKSFLMVNQEHRSSHELKRAISFGYKHFENLRSLRELFEYYKPGFHPNNTDDTKLVAMLHKQLGLITVESLRTANA